MSVTEIRSQKGDKRGLSSRRIRIIVLIPTTGRIIIPYFHPVQYRVIKLMDNFQDFGNSAQRFSVNSDTAWQLCVYYVPGQLFGLCFPCAALMWMGGILNKWARS